MAATSTASGEASTASSVHKDPLNRLRLPEAVADFPRWWLAWSSCDAILFPAVALLVYNMIDRVVSYVCPHCKRVFKTVISCQRHLSRSLVGLPSASHTIVLLYGLLGPEDAFAHVSTGSASAGGVAAGSAGAGTTDQARASPVVGDEEVVYMEDAPPEVDTFFLCVSADPPACGGSISARVRELYESFDDAASSRAMHASSVLRPSRFDSRFLRSALRHATLAN